MDPADYVILFITGDEGGFTIGRYITNERMQAGLVKMNHQLL